MRVKSIELSWFRGAGEIAVLESNSKNVVVYGQNGSGKSSFADAIEYIITGGKIKHLTHEYSGHKQISGIRNTHAPTGVDSTISMLFDDDNSVNATIRPNGSSEIGFGSQDLERAVGSWDLQRLILRQDEVANFIHARKGEKYSALLPLLGLETLDQAATNLHKLQKTIEQKEIEPRQQRLGLLKRAILKHLTDTHEKTLRSILAKLGETYLGDKAPSDIPTLLDELESSINNRIKSSTPESDRYRILSEILNEDLSEKLSQVVSAKQASAGKIDGLINHRIDILEKSVGFIGELNQENDYIECPACGSKISVEEFKVHVRDELNSLTEIRSARNKLKKRQGKLLGSIKNILRATKNKNFSSWRNESEQAELNDVLTKIETLDTSAADKCCSDDGISLMKEVIPLLVSIAEASSSTAPPPTQKLIADLTFVEAGKKSLILYELQAEIEIINDLIQQIRRSELKVRDEIRTQTTQIINNITGDIQRLWSIIHPDEPIEEVRLQLPQNADKAIDIGLKFFGVQQESPRITLSEGHRNSLGLCIFLALSLADEDDERPIFLDDIISSLDREHRGELLKVLKEELTNRQVFLFTHDREWFSELQMRLPQSSWDFFALKPWADPSIGIQWSRSKDTFDDARAIAEIRPESAGNTVRSIMDTYLAIAAENLRIPMQYLRGDRNDHRTCVDFLQRIRSEAKKRMKKQDNGSLVAFKEPLEPWMDNINAIISLGNRGTHTGSLTRGEVNDLIDICERSMGFFKCGSCDEFIWNYDNQQKGILQCGCGELQWKYD